MVWQYIIIMILIADSGSTKTDWIAIDENGNQILEPIKTKGLNPSVFSKGQLESTISKNNTLLSVKDKVTHIFFYGAGCGTNNFKQLLKSILESFFTQAKVDVHEDTMAAVYATIQSPQDKAVVCILGTGSNCSYYDGGQLQQRVTSLGYSVMDDASGNYFGRQLLRDYYFDFMPDNLKQAFKRTFSVSADVIKQNLYKEAHPNAYLAHFGAFMVTHKDEDYISELFKSGLSKFTLTMIYQYEEYLQKVPVNFVGSIAYFFQEEIHEIAKEFNFKVGCIVKSPIENLVGFHFRNLL